MKIIFSSLLFSLVMGVLPKSDLILSNINGSDSEKLPATTYCEAEGEAPWEEFITTVSYGTVDYLPIGDFDDNGNGKNQYGDFTDQVSSLTRGYSFELHLISKLKNIPDELYYYSIWIDYDQDGIFGANELIATIERDYNGQQFFNDNINVMPTIPIDATLGITRMRIIMRRGTAPDPCGDFDFGEVEDYSIDIQDVPVIPDPPKTFIALSDEVNSNMAYISNDLNFTFEEKYNIGTANKLLLCSVTDVTTADHDLKFSFLIPNNYGKSSHSINTNNFSLAGGRIYRLKLENSNKNITKYLNFKKI